ncbi:MAG: DNA mismatch repair protein MutS [Bacteroidales bacterium]|nr:DNA mismatch repair protein MutS [Bacteroidales bacterium]
MAKMAEDTPLIKQFFEVKAQHPEALLLYRVGDFYESYSDDAVTAARVLGLVQTKKSNGEKGPIPMAGFPHHAIETYLTKLVRAGYKVAICDQLEDPKFAKKLVKRGVTEIVTPGISFGENMLEQKENNFLCGLAFEKEQCGAAFLDVSTGQFQVAQGSLDYISTLLGSLNPKELVVPHSYAKGVRDRFGDFYTTSLDEWAFVYDAAVEKLKRQLSVDNLKGFALETMPLGVCAAGALLVYLEQTQHAGLKNICSVSRIDEAKFVWMDSFTLRNLEVFQSASGRDGVSLVQTLDKCSSPMGARLLRNWLAMPILDRKELDARYDIVEFFTLNPDILQETQTDLGKMGDLDRILGRIATGKAFPREIMQLSRGLGLMKPIQERCLQKGCAPLDKLLKGLTGCERLLKEIIQTLDPEPAAQIGKGPVIAEGVDSELDELRGLSGSGKDYLLQMQQREAERTGISSLKIAYNNVFGYYIEVRNTFKDKVPPEWIRKQTLVNAERYITEELKEYEEKIVTAESRIYEIETRLYARLIADIQEQIAAIQRNSRILSKLDVLAGFAEQAVERHYCRPEINDSQVLDIKAGRHPVIETLMGPGEQYVPNDVYLDSKTRQIIILTGPNMAGKSALLRQTALIVLMAQTGSFVPADAASIGWFDKIFTRVGATDNISRGESTFMVEMLETSMILHNLSARSLVLLDEIGRGTSTYDGMSIARAIVEYIHEYGKGAKTLFATHYHELNDLEGIFPRVKNFHVTVKEVGREVIFLRKIKEGGTAHSFGIHVARMAGMPKPVLESAERTLKALENSQALERIGALTPVRPHTVKEGRVEKDGSIQLSMFQLDDPLLESLRDRLKQADLNNMTPLQAFDLLRSMKDELGI